MLSALGLPKLAEELSELIEESAKLIHYIQKKLSYWETDHHPDGFSFKEKIEEEAADVLAAMDYVIKYYKLNNERIQARRRKKYSHWLSKQNTKGFLESNVVKLRPKKKPKQTIRPLKKGTT